ncbi:MAG: metal-dependent transcriptional regulator [Cumulibacter sp.]
MPTRRRESTPMLTPVAQDYLKVIWSATEWGSAPATVSSLAERMNTTRATASATLGRLESLGLLAHERYGPIRLTAAGRRHAIQMVRRHRLIETFLVRELGYRWDEVHDEAEQLEHAVSDRFVDSVARVLGAPDVDPHGDPIPDADGTVRYPQHVLALSDAEPGRYRVVRVSDADPQQLRMLSGHGLSPGAEVELGAEPLDLPDDAASAVMVQPLD